MNRLEEQEANHSLSETLYSKIKGTTFYKIPWDSIQPGEKLTVIRDKYNKYDSNAIALYYRTAQLGHISKELAEQFAIALDNRTASMDVYVTEITGGECQFDMITQAAKKKQYGINIKIVVTHNREALANQFLVS